ncbi:MAG: hypothetical protein R3C14_31760 [Caldilineaceae bacterium]
MFAEQKMDRYFYAMMNLAVVAAVGGAVILLANNLEQISPQGFIDLFAGLTLLCTLVGFWQQWRGAEAASQSWIFWGGIAYGVTVFAGGHFWAITTFIPNLLLLWLAGLALLAFFNGNPWQMGLVAVLNLVWLGMTFLYGYSYWPALVLLLVLVAFVWQRRRSGAVFFLTLVNALALVNCYLYALLEPGHFPLTFSVMHALVTFALLGAVSGVAGVRRRPVGVTIVLVDEANALWPYYARILGWTTTLIGLATLMAFNFRVSWDALSAAYDSRLFGVVIGFTLLMVAAVLVFSRPTTAGTRPRFVLWAGGFLLLVTGMNSGMMAFAAQHYLPLSAVVLAIGLAMGFLRQGARQRSWLYLSMGLLLLLTATISLMTEWMNNYQMSALVLAGVAMLILLTALQLQRHRAESRPQPARSLSTQLAGEAAL